MKVSSVYSRNTQLYLGSDSLKGRLRGVPPAQARVDRIPTPGLMARFSVNNE